MLTTYQYKDMFSLSDAFPPCVCVCVLPWHCSKSLRRHCQTSLAAFMIFITALPPVTWYYQHVGSPSILNLATSQYPQIFSCSEFEAAIIPVLDAVVYFRPWFPYSLLFVWHCSLIFLIPLFQSEGYTSCRPASGCAMVYMAFSPRVCVSVQDHAVFNYWFQLMPRYRSELFGPRLEC